MISLGGIIRAAALIVIPKGGKAQAAAGAERPIAAIGIDALSRCEAMKGQGMKSLGGFIRAAALIVIPKAGKRKPQRERSDLLRRSG